MEKEIRPLPFYGYPATLATFATDKVNDIINIK